MFLSKNHEDCVNDFHAGGLQRFYDVGVVRPSEEGFGADGKPLLMIILMSWGLAFFEYCFMIPANRLGSAGGLNVAQLKIIQEVITLCVFIPFALFYIGEKWKWDYLWAFLCVLGAVFFVNRERLFG